MMPYFEFVLFASNATSSVESGAEHNNVQMYSLFHFINSHIAVQHTEMNHI